jgi:hypothetical protein
MTKDETIAAIAKKQLSIQSLDTQNSDSGDCHDCAVWSIKAALEAAYEAGRAAAR